MKNTFGSVLFGVVWSVAARICTRG